MKKTIAALLGILAIIALPLATSAGTKGTWTGWITDDSCGAKGAKAEHADCARRCLENGGKLVFYNTADEKIYSLDNQEAAKGHIGHQVKVTGEAEGNDIKVEKIEKAGDDHAGHGH
jgi:hypothetical protein